MKLRKAVTVDDILAWKPCDEWNRERIAAAFGDRKRVSPLEILAADSVPPEDRLWCLLRLGFLSDANLRLFACDCAERALHRERKVGRGPDRRSWNAVAVARKFARGAATRKELIAARSAAWGTPWSAAGNAAERAAACSARSAAWSVSWNSAAGSAELACQLKQLKKYLLSATKTPAAT